MSEQKWVPQIGDHVWHVCEYALSNAALKAKGLEGFRPYGVEVVESVVKSPYHWKNADQGCMSVSEKRDVGDNANSEFYWKISDYGRSVFPTKEEAAVLAGERAHDMDHGIFSTKYNSKPMYKNWMHWSDEEKKKVTQLTITTKAKITRKGPKKKPLPDNFEAVYAHWRDGELTNAEAARECGMPQRSFEEAGRNELNTRGEKRAKMVRRHETAKESFLEAYEKWKAGEITMAEAARECAVDYKSFRTRAFKRREKEEYEK